jgi:hypothetical protein
MLVASFALWSACAESRHVKNDGTTDADVGTDSDTRTESDTDTDADTDADSDADTDTDTDADSDTDTDADTDTDTTTTTHSAVRFVALGDAGEGNDAQYAVADAIKSVCDRDGCDFALYLGDNFYDSGVSDVDDAQFEEKFELPYAELDFPFYPVLGNHDYGGEGIGWELWKGQTYVDYSAYSDKWTMPDLYYTHVHGDVTFFALDTTEVFWGVGSDEQAWLQSETPAATTWSIAYGHHPYLSNGTHGNAGNYEGLSWLPIVNGASIQEFVEDAICGQVDVYISGHDHSLQWPEGTCGTEFLVSGAGSKTTELPGEDPTYFQDQTEGFLWVEIVGNTFTGVYYDSAGNELFRRSFTK